MVSSSAATVDEYLSSLPEDRRAAITRVRDVVNAHLPPGYEEGMMYGMISWFIPLSRYPDTHHGQPLALASLASQKSHMAIYLMTVYGDPAMQKWFTAAYKATGKKLDMGKSCVRFKTLDALPLDVIGEAIARVPIEKYLARYEAFHAQVAKDTAKTMAKTKAKAKRVAKKPATKRRR